MNSQPPGRPARQARHSARAQAESGQLAAHGPSVEVHVTAMPTEARSGESLARGRLMRRAARRRPEAAPRASHPQMFGYQCHLAAILAGSFVTLQEKGLWQLKQQGAWQPLCSAPGKAQLGDMHACANRCRRSPGLSAQTGCRPAAAAGTAASRGMPFLRNRKHCCICCSGSVGSTAALSKPSGLHELLASGRLSSLSGALRLASAHWAVSSRSSSACEACRALRSGAAGIARVGRLGFTHPATGRCGRQCAMARRQQHALCTPVRRRC